MAQCCSRIKRKLCEGTKDFDNETNVMSVGEKLLRMKLYKDR